MSIQARSVAPMVVMSSKISESPMAVSSIIMLILELCIAYLCR